LIKLGLVGYPATYSLSPVLFAAAFRAAGIDGSYKVFPTHANDLRDTIWQLATQGYRGVNVTTPHKEAALHLAQQPNPDATLAHAANILRFDTSNQIAAFNTDISALVRVITEAENLYGRMDSALILGSSGAARAAVLALGRDLGVGRISIAARHAHGLVGWVDGVSHTLKTLSISLVDWEERDDYVAVHKPALVINATTLGWHGDDDFPLYPEHISGVKFVLDLNYPRPNHWLSAMRERHIPCWDGKMMLFWQAALGFEIFTGEKAPLDAMRTALEKEAGNLDD
jgi:shikimate dehydrogenase